jgi:hypothetical protein
MRGVLLRRGFALEYVTLAWNVAGIVVLGFAAVAARSVALAGFGLDSLIEIGASTVVIWELSGTGAERQRRGLRLIGSAFAALAVYLLVQSTVVLAAGYHPGHSVLGIAWTAVTAAAMFTLAAGKARTGRALDNPVLRTEGRVTMIDGILAVAVLLGLALNAALGWWWADPVAGYVLVYYAAREVREIRRGQTDALAGADLVAEDAGGGEAPGAGGGGAGLGRQDAGAAEQHRDGHEDEAVGQGADGDLVGHHPTAQLIAEDMTGTVREVDAAGDDDYPDQGIRHAGPGNGPARLAVIGNVEERPGQGADERPGRQPGDLQQQAVPGGSRALEEERDDDGRRDDRAQQPHRGDLAAAEVGGQHDGQDDEVEDPYTGVHAELPSQAPLERGAAPVRSRLATRN